MPHRHSERRRCSLDHAADIDDDAVPSSSPRRHHGADRSQRSHHVGVELSMHQVVIDQFEGALHLEAGVVDQDVDRVGVGESRCHRIRVAHIQLANLDRQALRLSVGEQRCTLRLVAHRGDDVMAPSGQRERGESPEPAVAAGDQDAQCVGHQAVAFSPISPSRPIRSVLWPFAARLIVMPSMPVSIQAWRRSPTVSASP